MSAVSLAEVANLSLQMQGSVLSYLCAMITIEKGLENPMNKKIWKINKGKNILIKKIIKRKIRYDIL